MKVWLIVEGEYSDFRVLDVVASEEDARAVIATGYGGDYTEFEIRPAGWLPTKRVLWTASAAVGHRKADMDEAPRTDGYVFWNDAEPDFEIDRLVEKPILVKHRANQNRTSLYYRSFDRERAIKVVSDRAAQLKAEREDL